jgi:cell division protease FtsH
LKQYKSMLVWVVLILLFVFLYQGFKSGSTSDEISFTQFIHSATTAADGQAVDEVKVRGQAIEGTFKDGRTFRTSGDLKDFHKDLIAKGVDITYEREDANALWISILSTWLPMLLLLGLFFFFMRQLQSGGNRAMSFGKSRAKMMTENTNKVTFEDVAGIEESKNELQEIIHFLKDPKKFTKLGGRIPKGVLLMGPPGTGKTLLARAVAGEAGVPFFSISGSDFVEMFVGVGASRVRDLFEQGKKNAPCIIFIDEIDAVGRHRGAGMGGGHDEREQTLNQLLVEMDGFENNTGVILVAATNRPDVLDPALLRAGRFDRRVVVPTPDAKGRQEILKVHTRKVPLSPDVDLQLIARGTPGFAGADLENLVNEAALQAARFDHELVAQVDFEASKDKVLMGTERRGMMMNAEELRLTAVHEAGHALVSKHLKSSDPLHKVTIVPRGRALGVTMQLPERDRYSHNSSYLNDRISIMMGGRIAEDEVLGEITTGASNDIEQATDLARQMVCEWGMSRLGPLSYGKKTGEPFLGRDYGHTQNFSESTAVQVDQEIRRIVEENYNRAKEVLTEHREQLDRLTNALLEFETLDGEEVDWIMVGRDIRELRGNREAHWKHRAQQDAAAAVNTPTKKPTTPVIDSLPGLPEPLTH